MVGGGRRRDDRADHAGPAAKGDPHRAELSLALSAVPRTEVHVLLKATPENERLLAPLRECGLLQASASRLNAPYLSRILRRRPWVLAKWAMTLDGRIGDINHIVYVDPERYAALSNRAELKAVGRAVGELNKLLPKKQFILMGPGRWGSRGDIKLGVSVTYADINNTAMLIEIARRSGDYVPDVSFGTHFFQDLVESGIVYLPLYPDDLDVVWNEAFLNETPNQLAEHAHLFEKLERRVQRARTARARSLPSSAARSIVSCCSAPSARNASVCCHATSLSKAWRNRSLASAGSEGRVTTGSSSGLEPKRTVPSPPERSRNTASRNRLRSPSGVAVIGKAW